MTDPAHQLRDMADTRRAALHNQARRDAAMALIEQQGSATTAEIDARVADTLTLPSRTDLADAMARKAAAGAEHAAANAEAARAAVESARTKRDKLAALLDAADTEIGRAETEADEADARAAAAAALAEYATHGGNPDGDQPGPDSAAHADAAQAAAGSED